MTDENEVNDSTGTSTFPTAVATPLLDSDTDKDDMDEIFDYYPQVNYLSLMPVSDWISTYGTDPEFGLRRNRRIVTRAFNKMLTMKYVRFLTRYGIMYLNQYPINTVLPEDADVSMADDDDSELDAEVSMTESASQAQSHMDSLQTGLLNQSVNETDYSEQVDTIDVSVDNVYEGGDDGSATSKSVFKQLEEVEIVDRHSKEAVPADSFGLFFFPAFRSICYHRKEAIENFQRLVLFI